MPRDSRLELIEIKPEARGAGRAVARLLEAEGRRLVSALPRGCVKVLLDERGELFASAGLARRMERWRAGGRDVSFLVGGPDGVAEAVRGGADLRWSLTPLTLPHGLARVVLAEQLYRAVSILQNHPYHRP
jgi:23S rRNA (pseudouridine1915-N3)-methyltransferase